jgi:capsular polysaccharide biosynthesis protein
VNDADETMTRPGGIGNDPPSRLWAVEDSTAGEDRPTVDPTKVFIDLAFIRAALRRRAWFLCATALAGLLIGAGLYVKYPPAYQASTSVLVQDGSGVDPTVAVQNDATLAQSRTVAAQVVRQLGLQQSVTSFQAASSVAYVTPEVLLITVSAPTSSGAVARASALATSFLRFHTEYARIQQKQLEAGLDEQLSQAQQQLDSIKGQVNKASAQPSSPAQQSSLANLQKQLTAASNTLGQVEQYVTSTLAAARTNTSSIVNDSRVVDAAAPISHSRLKAVALHVAGGLVGGLAVGVAIVILLALVSDRLRRRDDVTDAMGAPVRLSVGALGARRWLPRFPGRASMQKLNMRRVVAYLHSVVPGSSRGPAGLAVVAVDNARMVAPAVTALAVSYASQGKQVVLADLSAGTCAARLLGVKGPGIRAVDRKGVHITVVIPDQDDIAPVGPLYSSAYPVRPVQASEALLAACASADLLLTMTTLDPAFGGDYLATWATDAVAVVAAGQSSGERIHGVGEMIRLGGMRLDSTVLIGADKRDESLGVMRTQDESAPVGSL